MTTLSSHEAITELLSLMQDNGREPLAEELVAAIAGLDILEEQYSVLLSMVYDKRKQFTETPSPASMQIPAQVFQEELEQILGQLSAEKEKIIVWCKTTMESFGQVGVSALDTAFSDLGIPKLLWDIQEKVEYSMAKVMVSLQQTDKKRAVLLSVLIAACTSPSKMKRFASKAANIVEQEQEGGKKPSLWMQLRRKKEEAAAHPASKPAQNQKEAER